MKKQKMIIAMLPIFVVMVLGVYIIGNAQTSTMYTYFMDANGNISNTVIMDAVAAVKTDKSTLSGVTYSAGAGVLTINGLQADTLRIYTDKLQLKGTSKITNFVVNTGITNIDVATGTEFKYTNISGRKAATFAEHLNSDTTGGSGSVSKGTISLDKTSATIYAAGTGNTVTLKATTSGSGTVKWASSNTAVATVNNGVVKGVKAGNANITATLFNTNNVEVAKATCAVTVKAATLTLNSSNITVYAKGTGNTTVLTATVNGVAASGSTVTWKSSNTAVATVSNGTVKGIKAGTATITATANGVSTTSTVTVKEPTLKLSKTSATIYTKGEKNITLTATVNGVSVAGSDVSWSTSDKSVATVENGKVTAVAVGTATITAKANGVSKTCQITVKKPSITVSPTSVTIKKGKTAALTVTVRPSSGKPTYSSSKKSVATVSDTGVITGVAAGTATITVTCNGATATVQVTVTK